MRLIKKVSVIEVKRCFVVSQLVRWKRRHHGCLKLISKEDFRKRVAIVSRKVCALSTKQLDRIIAKEWKKRLRAYNESLWYLAEVKLSEVGVWRRAGELPLAWTNRSLVVDTAKHIAKVLESKRWLKLKRTRAAFAIRGILKTNVDLLQSEKYLLPIVFKGGTGTKGRRGLKYRTVGDIDDGRMRSIAFAINGTKTIKVYYGVPKMVSN